MKWVNPTTQSMNVPQQLDATQPPLPAQLLKHGWRMWDEIVPPLAPGYERLSARFAQDPNDPTKAVLVVVDGSIAEREAREAAEREAEKDRRATLDQSDALLRAVAVEVVQQIETIKGVVRAAHPASGGTIPARSAEEWAAAIKARARGYMP
jgi:hypothetical protein